MDHWLQSGSIRDTDVKIQQINEDGKKNYNNYVKSPPEDFCHLDQPRPSDLKSHMVHLSSSLRCFKITMFKKENTVTIIPYWGFHLLVMKAAYTGNMLFIAKCLQKHSVRPFLLSCHLKHKCKHGGTKSFAGFFFFFPQCKMQECKTRGHRSSCSLLGAELLS